jgi:hypothetical protein
MRDRSGVGRFLDHLLEENMIIFTKTFQVIDQNAAFSKCVKSQVYKACSKSVVIITANHWNNLYPTFENAQNESLLDASTTFSMNFRGLPTKSEKYEFSETVNLSLS